MVKVGKAVVGLELGLATVRELVARLSIGFGALVVIEQRNLDATDWRIADPPDHSKQLEGEAIQSAEPSSHGYVAALAVGELGVF